MSSKYKKATNPPKSAQHNRPRWLLPVIFGIAALAIVAAVVWLVQGRQTAVTYTPEVAGQPSAVIDQTAFDYGDVKLGSTVETVFHVKNVGDRPLTFQGEPRVEVREGC